MGNYRFKLSDMMPNAWFYKLRDMGGLSKPIPTIPKKKNKKKKNQPSYTQNNSIPNDNSYPRKSYYFTRDLNLISSPQNDSPIKTHIKLLDPPRKSSKQSLRKKMPTTSSSPLSTHCRCPNTAIRAEPDSYPTSDYSTAGVKQAKNSLEFDRATISCVGVKQAKNSLESDRATISCRCRFEEQNQNDIVLEIDNTSFGKNFDNIDGFDKSRELDLRPIKTKPGKLNEPVKKQSTSKRKQSSEKRVVMSKPKTVSSLNSPGVRVGQKTPRIASRKSTGRKSVSSSVSSSRKSLSDSMAVVKSSMDPQSDFRESMVEMISENDIKTSKELEELLACYLCLNSDEYHDVIISVFKQIWFDLTHLKKLK